jgi:hypothetical protein
MLVLQFFVLWRGLLNLKLASEIGRVNLLKVDLHNGNYCSKLVPFEAQKYFLHYKKAQALRCHSVNTTLEADLHYSNYHSKLVRFKTHKNIFSF